MKKYKYIKNPAQLKEKLDKIVHEIHSIEDPHAITEYRNFFKSNIKFFHRTLIAAYLTKKFIASDSSSSNNSRNSRRLERQSEDRQEGRDTRNRRQDTQSNKESDSNTSNRNTNAPRKVSINVGALLATETEISQYLNSFPEMNEANISIVKHAQKYTVFSINSQSVKKLLEHTKITPLKDKKVFIDLHRRY